MNKIEPFEIMITGGWLLQGTRMVADNALKRIRNLISTHLSELGKDSTGWNVLYRDPDDGRLWELVYPHGELQGGGPPQLRCISFPEAN